MSEPKVADLMCEKRMLKGVRICGVDGCERKHLALGMCTTHYKRWTSGLDLGVNKLKTGTEKLGESLVVQIRLSSLTNQEWVELLVDQFGMELHRNAIYQARTGRTYKEIPMDRESLMKLAEEYKLEVL